MRNSLIDKFSQLIVEENMWRSAVMDSDLASEQVIQFLNNWVLM